MNTVYLIQRFDAWITTEYNRLRERLSITVLFDEDAFHDAYIIVRTALTEDNATDNYSTAFCQAYKKICKQHVNEDFAVCNPEDLFFNQLLSRATYQTKEPEIQEDRPELIREIREYVRHNYSPMSVMIWESRNLRSMSYSDINAMSGIGTNKVKQIIKTINGQVRQKFSHAINYRL